MFWLGRFNSENNQKIVTLIKIKTCWFSFKWVI